MENVNEFYESAGTISIRMVSDILYSIATQWVSLSMSFLWKDVSMCIGDNREFHPRLQF